jgi:hypothetical protein
MSVFTVGEDCNSLGLIEVRHCPEKCGSDSKGFIIKNDTVSWVEQYKDYLALGSYSDSGLCRVREGQVIDAFVGPCGSFVLVFLLSSMYNVGTKNPSSFSRTNYD